MRAKIMKITYTDSRDGMVLIGFTDERGEHEIALSTIETADLIGALRTSLEEAIGSPAANSMGLPSIERVQIVETAEEVFFRVYMNDRISHDYPGPKGTVLADELRMMADRMEARNSARPHIRHPISKRAAPSGRMSHLGPNIMLLAGGLLIMADSARAFLEARPYAKLQTMTTS